jgi:hypothetical protein
MRPIEHVFAYDDDGDMIGVKRIVVPTKGASVINENHAAEYAICQRRGHEPSDRWWMVDGSLICKWCGTQYRFEQVIHEHNTPTPPKAKEPA